MNEELINQIVRRILSDPSLQGLLQGSGNLEGSEVVKSEALVLLNYVSDFPRVLRAVQQRWGECFTLRVLPSDQVFLNKPELPVDMTWITVEEAFNQENWSKIIVPACSANTLAKAALGIRDNPICEMIGRGLSRGSSVELVTEHLGFTEQTPEAYRGLYQGYVQTLQTYGVVIYSTLEDRPSDPGKLTQEKSVRVEQPSAVLQPMNRPVNTAAASAPNEIRYPKKFLGDKQAYGFPEGATVFVSQGTVISPLARDTLKLRRVELCIEKEDGR